MKLRNKYGGEWEMFRCEKCLTLSTRPRVQFRDGICNACHWAEKKKEIDWDVRWKKLEALCDQYRKPGWNVIVPVSGGKDGSYVAYVLKTQLGMTPLCVTFTPPMQTDLGRQNLENFRNSGYDLMELRPNPEVYRKLCKKMFIEQARSKFPFVIGIGTAVSQFALATDIRFIIWGEEGESEYGGKPHESQDFITWEYMRNIYHEGNDISKWTDEFSRDDLQWWLLPSKYALKKLRATWWSKWEPWDSYRHREIAIKHCGLQGSEQIGTQETHSQVDDYLQDLFMFECFIKFGFGRATADCNLAIKEGRMTRAEGLEIVKEIDGQFPLTYLERYLEFFDMTEKEFWQVIESHVNYDILKATGNKRRPYILK